MRYFQRVATSQVDGIDYFDRTCFNFSLFISVQKSEWKWCWRARRELNPGPTG